MAQQIINNGEQGLSVRGKLNTMFGEVYPTLPPYGTVYSDNFIRASLGTNYTKIGATASFVITANKLIVSGGVGDLNQYIMYNQVKTNLEQWTRTLTIDSIGTVNSSSFGIALGLQSQGDNSQLFSIQVIFNTSTAGLGGGELYWIMNQAPTNPGNFAQYSQISTTRLGISTNDALTFRLIRNKNVFTAIITNTTTGRQIEDTFILEVSYPPIAPGPINISVATPNVGYHALYTCGGTQTISNDVVTSDCGIGADVLMVGDSIFGGFYAYNINSRACDLLQQAYQGTFNVYAGTGNRIEDVTSAEIIALAPKKIVIMIGTINLFLGDSAGTIATKLAALNTALTTAGYVEGTSLFYCLLMPRNSHDVSTVNANIASTYPNFLDMFTTFRSGLSTAISSFLSPDGVHPNQLCEQKIASVIANRLNLVKKSNARFNDIPVYPPRQPVAVQLFSDAINNNGTPNTMQDVPGLSFQLKAGTEYYFKFFVHFTAAASTTGSRWSINGPTFSTLNYRSQYSLNIGSVFTVNEGLNTYDTPAAASINTPPTLLGIAIIEGVILPTADGTLVVRFASEVAGSAITAKAFYSWGQLTALL